jgi:hypothetical protein
MAIEILTREVVAVFLFILIIILAVVYIIKKYK